MRDLEIRGPAISRHDQSGPVAAVGYDLYVQLVAEAVADAKGFVVPGRAGQSRRARERTCPRATWKPTTPGSRPTADWWA